MSPDDLRGFLWRLTDLQDLIRRAICDAKSYRELKDLQETRDKQIEEIVREYRKVYDAKTP